MSPHVIHRDNGSGSVLCQSMRMNPQLTAVAGEVTCKQCRTRQAKKYVHPEVRARHSQRAGMTAATTAPYQKFERR